MPDFIDADSGKIMTIENVGEECRRVRLEKGLMRVQLLRKAKVSASVMRLMTVNIRVGCIRTRRLMTYWLS